MTNPTFTLETITPDMAREILERNTINRKPSPTHIAKLALHMTNGTFMVTGDMVRIGTDGTLYDGQHRLLACIEADIPFVTMVARNVAHDALRVIDGGKSRSKQQQLKIADGIDPMATNIVLMLCRFAVGAKYDADLTTDTIHKIVERHPAISETAEAYKGAVLFTLGANIPAAELILKAHGYHAEADAWRSAWINGYTNELGKAAIAFREAMIRDNAKPTGKIWPHVHRRKLLTTILLRAFAGVGASDKWKGSTTMFKGVTAAELLSTTTFTKAERSEDRAITVSRATIASVRSHYRDDQTAMRFADAAL